MSHQPTPQQIIQSLQRDLAAAQAENAELRRERDRLEHDVDALSKYCLQRAVLFEQNPDVCQTYTEQQQKAWAILSLSARERIESERHQYVVKLDALREEVAAAEARAKTPAEQAVLAGMAKIPDHVLRWHIKLDGHNSDAAYAELARRAEPQPVCKCGTGHPLDCPVHKPAPVCGAKEGGE